jgi:alanyl-tRNA synthetase
MSRVEASRRVIDGAAVFRLMDTHGVPFEVIQEELRHRQLAFDVFAFCEAAANSRNWKPSRLVNLLLAFAPDEDSRRLVRLCVLRAYADASP